MKIWEEAGWKFVGVNTDEAECIDCGMCGHDVNSDGRCEACAIGVVFGQEAKEQFIDDDIAKLHAWYESHSG